LVVCITVEQQNAGLSFGFEHEAQIQVTQGGLFDAGQLNERIAAKVWHASGS
jgi:hypothetical protein